MKYHFSLLDGSVVSPREQSVLLDQENWIFSRDAIAVSDKMAFAAFTSRFLTGDQVSPSTWD